MDTVLLITTAAFAALRERSRTDFPLGTYNFVGGGKVNIALSVETVDRIRSIQFVGETDSETILRLCVHAKGFN